MQAFVLKRLDDVLVRMAGARVIVLVVFHAVVFAASFVATIALLAPGLRDPRALATPEAILIVVGVQLLVGVAFHFYRGWWRYVAIGDSIRMAGGVSIALAILLGLSAMPALPASVQAIPPRVLVVDAVLALLALYGARVLLRLLKDRLAGASTLATEKRVLIVGAEDAGEALARALSHQPRLGITVVAFVDDTRAKWRSHIRGVEVLGPISAVGEIARETGAREALIAIPAASGQRMREIVGHLVAAGLAFKTIPSLDELVGGVEVSQIRPVNLEDLLRRQPVSLPADRIAGVFDGKAVLITGAGGTIGSELARQVIDLRPSAIHLVERSEYALFEIVRALAKRGGGAARVQAHLCDVRDERAIQRLLEQASPHVVLHAAAHKHVPLGEDNAPEYLVNNCLATRRFADACAAARVHRFVLISTDKAINPISVMGATKRAAEIVLLDLARRAEMSVSIVRFGNVLGSSGSVVPLFMEQIASGGPVTVTHPDVTRYFLRTSEAVALVLQAVALGGNGQVYTLDMGEPVRIADLARDLIRLADRRPEEIEIVFTGLRPGEKLVEELRRTGEPVRSTVHAQIVVTEPVQPDAEVVGAWLRRADEIAARGQSAAAITALEELIEEYRPRRESRPGERPSPAATTPVPARPSPAVAGASRSSVP